MRNGRLLRGNRSAVSLARRLGNRFPTHGSEGKTEAFPRGERDKGKEREERERDFRKSQPSGEPLRI
jgi:hypothetical protein